MKRVLLVALFLAGMAAGALVMARAGGWAAAPAGSGAEMVASGGDDTAAWDAACAAIPVGGSGEIRLRAGVFRAGSAWVCNGRGVTVRGSGRGSTVIAVSHTGTGMSLSPGSVSLQTTVRDLTLQATGACASAQALSISYPAAPYDSFLLSTTAISHLEVKSDGQAGGCNPRSFLSALNLHGLWNSEIDDVVATGPYVIPPLAGTAGIRYSKLINVNFNHVTLNIFDYGIVQEDYSEGLTWNFPNIIVANIGWKILPASVGGGGYNGLSFGWNNAECASVVRCLDMQHISRGWVHDCRCTFRGTGQQDVHILLQDSEGWMVHDNAFEEGANATGMGVRVSGAGSVLNQVHDNSCVNILNCVRFEAGTTLNSATNNVMGQHWAGGGAGDDGSHGAFVDLGVNNFMSWIGGRGEVVNAADQWVTAPVTLSAFKGGAPAGRSTFRYRKSGRLVVFTLTVAVTEGHGGAGFMKVALPFTSADGVIGGYGRASNGKPLTAALDRNGSTLNVFGTNDSSYPVNADGESFDVSGFFEATN